jgi:hypothetical protein
MARDATTLYGVDARRLGLAPVRPTGGEPDGPQALSRPRLSLRAPPGNEDRAKNGTVAAELRRTNLDVV